MLEVACADQELVRLEKDASLDAHYEPGIGKKYRWVMQVVRQSVTKKSQLHQFRSLNLEKLQRPGDDWSMRLNKKWRLIVQFSGQEPDEKITIMGIEKHYGD